jgi:methanogenic corrinoid protein MtbC1
MAPMKQQPITDGSLSEAEAIRMVRGLGGQETRQHPREHQQHRNLLSCAVENEVIPRLLTASRLRTLAMLEEMPVAITDEHVDAMVQLVLEGKQSEATSYVESLQKGGVPAHRLFLDLLAPAARKLGKLWEDDSCDFTDVTMGVMRLRNVMHLIGTALENECQPGPFAPRILLFQAPGEQHGFGLAMVAHFFRAAGYAVHCETAPSAASLVTLVASESFGVAGVSVACTDHLPAVTRLLAEMRRASRNPRLGIMAGGSAFALQPIQPGDIGADFAASDGLQAVEDAQALLARLALER